MGLDSFPLGYVECGVAYQYLFVNRNRFIIEINSLKVFISDSF